MFNFLLTPLSGFFILLTFVVFIPLLFIKEFQKNIFLFSLLFVSLIIIFLSDNFITMFVGWEIMGWSSFFILSKTSSVKTSQKYIAFNIAGAFTLFAAMVLIYGYSGTFTFSQIDFHTIPSNMILLISTLFLITIFIKSGILPFHFWIVDSYNESNEVLSTLLSSIISKSGIYLFILVFYSLIPIELSEPIIFKIVTILGVITSIVATFKAIAQDEMKKLLAYSSIAQVGYIITALGVLSGSSLEAALYYTLIHTMTKLLLFVNIASIINATTKTKFSQLGNLLYTYPISFIFLVIGIISLASMPPLGGFSGKFLIYTTLLEAKESFILVAVMFSSAAAFLYCYKLVYGIYLGAKEDTQYKKIPFSYYIAQFVASVILIILGLFPAIIVPYLNIIIEVSGAQTVAFTDISTLNTQFGSLNGFVLMSLFAIIFIILLFLFSLIKNKTKYRANLQDISYCGEIPKKDTNLHYGYGMAKEMRRVAFIKTILENSSRYFWTQIENIIADISTVFQKIYTMATQNIVFVTIIFFAIILGYGVL